MQLPPDRRFHVTVWPVAVAVAALLVGFALGGHYIGPAFTDDELAEEAAARRAERFASRSIDPARHYLDPPTYRTPTPEFPDHGPANHAATAQERALNGIAANESDRHPSTHDAPDPGMASNAMGNAQDGVRAVHFDRHSNSHLY